MSKPPKLSNVQNKRMGGLIAILCGRRPYEGIWESLQKDGFCDGSDEHIHLTDDGFCELERLMTLCGLAVFYRNGEPDIQATNAQRSPDVTSDTR